MKKRFSFRTMTLVVSLLIGLSMLGTGVAFAAHSCSNQVTSVVTVVTNPELILSTDYATTAITAGVPYQFNVRLQNPSSKITLYGVGVDLVAWDGSDNTIVPTDVTLSYWAGGQWNSWGLSQGSVGTLTGTFGPSGGFTVGPSYDVITLFEVTYNTVGSYQFQIQATN